VASERVLRFQKWVIWAAFIGIVVLLRHLLAVIFLTFVLTYIGNTVLTWMDARWKFRRVNLTIIYLVLLLVISGITIIVVPRMFAETRQLAVLYVAKDPSQQQGVINPESPTMLENQTKKYVDTVLLQVFGESAFSSFQRSVAYGDLVDRAEEWIRGFIPKIVAYVREFVNASIFLVFQFLLAIILSFLILWDLPNLKRAIGKLATGNTAEIYEEIAPSMKAFGVILGRAFEAQTGIAILNAVLTSIGFFILGIPSIALLAMIVFFCSYIPVVGVMLSTIPAALLAFETGGITRVLGLVAMVLIVHAIEAYALNPIIYGRHMKMHPVLILVILLVGEHLFGIWGLLLGVPIAAFVKGYIIENGRTADSAPLVHESRV
jgi:predicted PurR-regulated permease PerM